MLSGPIRGVEQGRYSFASMPIFLLRFIGKVGSRAGVLSRDQYRVYEFWFLTAACLTLKSGHGMPSNTAPRRQKPG